MKAMYNIDYGEAKYDHDVTASALKIIAIITMFIDHVGASLLEWILFSEDQRFDPMVVGIVDTVFRCIGRAAFPLFIFMMAEGFYYTRSRKNYMIRMVAFCFVAEVPFDLAFGYYRTDVIDLQKNLFVTEYQNVMFTLTLGLAAIWLMNTFYEKISSVVVEILLDAAVVAAAAYTAEMILKTDYGAGGVLAVVAAHLARRFGLKPIFAGVGIIAILAIFSGEIELMAAIIDLPLLANYHGNRGRRLNRWFFYIFYPAHLLLLALFRITVFT